MLPDVPVNGEGAERRPAPRPRTFLNAFSDYRLPPQSPGESRPPRRRHPFRDWRNVYVVERAPAGGWSSPRRIAHGGGAARWSPDGREILYMRPDGIWVTTPAGGQGRQLLRADPTDPLILGNAEWSADGKQVFFKRFDGEGRTSFWSVPASGGVAKELVRLDRNLRSHRAEFATDGRRFFFTATERVSDIWTLELRSTR